MFRYLADGEGFVETVAKSHRSQSVHPAGRGIVRELNDRSSDAAPHGRPVLVAGSLELVGSGSAFLERLVAIPLEYESRRPPNVDLRDHALKLHVYGQ
jgi:hypothetical protein